jgi:DNA polymerase-3 subunit alpha
MLAGDDAGALASAARFREIFGPDHLFVELQDHGIPAQRQTMKGLFDIAQTLGAPVLATNDSHYVHRHDAEAHDALLCVQTGAARDDPKRFKFDADEFYLKTAQEMRDLFRGRPTPATTRCG